MKTQIIIALGFAVLFTSLIIKAATIDHDYSAQALAACEDYADWNVCYAFSRTWSADPNGVNGDSFAFQCLDTEYINPTTGLCQTEVPSCPDDDQGNPVEYDVVAKECPGPPPPPTCEAGETYDPLTATCIPDPIVCLPNEISIIGPLGTVTGCLAGPEPDDDCVVSQGMINDQELCADGQTTCEVDYGGTFGYAGYGVDTQPVCLESTYGGATCPSGSVRILMESNEGNSDWFECHHPDVIPSTICDGQIYDCDGDGNIDDQNHNGIVDNGISDDPAGATPITVAGEEPNVGLDDLNPATEGAGDCDPSSRNYAECVGFISSDSETEEPVDAGIQTGIGTGTGIGEEMGNANTRIANSNIVLAFQEISDVLQTGNTSCPMPSFDAFGATTVIDQHCTLIEGIQSQLSILMIIVFSIVGGRHIASA